MAKNDSKNLHEHLSGYMTKYGEEHKEVVSTIISQFAPERLEALAKKNPTVVRGLSSINPSGFRSYALNSGTSYDVRTAFGEVRPLSLESKTVGFTPEMIDGKGYLFGDEAIKHAVGYLDHFHPTIVKTAKISKEEDREAVTTLVKHLYGKVGGEFVTISVPDSMETWLNKTGRSTNDYVEAVLKGLPAGIRYRITPESAGINKLLGLSSDHNVLNEMGHITTHTAYILKGQKGIPRSQCQTVLHGGKDITLAILNYAREYNKHRDHQPMESDAESWKHSFASAAGKAPIEQIVQFGSNGNCKVEITDIVQRAPLDMLSYLVDPINTAFNKLREKGTGSENKDINLVFCGGAAALDGLSEWAGKTFAGQKPKKVITVPIKEATALGDFLEAAEVRFKDWEVWDPREATTI